MKIKHIEMSCNSLAECYARLRDCDLIYVSELGKKAKIVIADPMYRPVCPAGVKFISLPHEAFSGRIYRKEIPRLVIGVEEFLGQIQ